MLLASERSERPTGVTQLKIGDVCLFVIYVTDFGKIGLNAANNFFSVSRGKALWVDFFRKFFYHRNG